MFNRKWLSFCVVLVLNVTVVHARWNDSYDLYDLANLRRDYLSKYCPSKLPDLEKFLSCSSGGLSFANLPDNIVSDEISTRFHAKIQSWCGSSWPLQKECEKRNEQFVDACFSQDPPISVGWDIISAVFETACAKKEGENEIAYLVILRRNLRHWWYNERDVVSCFNEISLEYYKRDINMVLNCLKYQLRYRNCHNDCDNLLARLEHAVKSHYSSSGYVFLTSFNTTLINSIQFPVISNLKSCDNSGGFAYVAFFCLLILVIVTLGLLLFVKVECINSSCIRRYQRRVQHEEQLVQNQEGSNPPI